MQALMRLHKKWSLYERERRRLGMDGPWGLSGAMYIIATETERRAIARHNAIGNKRITAETYDPATDDYHTPRQWFDLLHERLRFTIDLAASKTAHLLQRYYTANEDALKQSWAGERGYLNPPWVHRNISKWVEYALTQDFELLLMCLPGEINSSWFHRFVWPRATALLVPDQRLQFGEANHSPWSVVFVLFASRAPWAVDAVADVPGFRLVRLSPATEELAPTRRATGDSGPTNHPRETVSIAPSIHVPAEPAPSERKRFWRTSPERWQELRRDWPNIQDRFCYPPGEDALALKTWGPRPQYVNANYRREDNPWGYSMLDVAKHCVRRNLEEGVEIILPVPTNDWTNVLIDADAEGRSWGRERWLDVDSDERWPDAGATTLFILRGRSR
jgi:hypothetical protein